MEIPIGNQVIKVARCEGCSGESLYLNWPAGWTQTGKSSYGTEYDSDGVGWWCSYCRRTEPQSLTAVAGGEN